MADIIKGNPYQGNFVKDYDLTGVANRWSVAAMPVGAGSSWTTEYLDMEGVKFITLALDVSISSTAQLLLRAIPNNPPAGDQPFGLFNLPGMGVITNGLVACSARVGIASPWYVYYGGNGSTNITNQSGWLPCEAAKFELYLNSGAGTLNGARLRVSG